MTYLLFTYLALTVFKVGVILLTIGMLYASATALTFVGVAIHRIEGGKGKYPNLKHFLISGSIMLVAALFPSKDDAYLLLGAYVSQNIVESDLSKELLSNIEARIKSSTEDILKGAGQFKIDNE